MWSVRNLTPYKAEGSWDRNEAGVHEWSVVVKATYDILPDGGTRLADEQVDPLLAPEYNGEPGASSLRYDADLVAPKPTTDVTINGTAYAPGGRPSDGFPVGARIGPIRKAIRVRGDRWWVEGPFGLTPTRAQPVARLPIVYERAFGGYDQTDPEPSNQRIDLRNPVGCGVAAQARHLVGTPVPNFEYPNGDLAKDGPAGFGAIASYWSPRRELQGTYDDVWERTRRPLLPDDWDPRSRQCAPADQHPEGHLRGGEPVELVNLTPGGRLAFALPKVYLSFRTQVDKRIEHQRGTLAAVILEPDVPRVIMVWSMSLPCRSDVDYLEETVIREKAYI